MSTHWLFRPGFLCLFAIGAISCSGGGGSGSGGQPLNSVPLPSQTSQLAANMTFLDFVHLRASAPPISTRSAAAFVSNAIITNAFGYRSTNLLYVSESPTNSYDVPGDVNIYSQTSHQMVGQITGLYSPASLTVDSSNNLYVVQVDNGAPVLVFAPGATKPFLRLQVPASLPTAATVGKDGDVFVAVSAYFGPITCHNQTIGNGGICVLFYKKSATTPYKSFATSGDAISQIIADRDNNLYYIWNEATDSALYELEANTEKPIYLGLNSVLNPSGQNGGGTFRGTFFDQSGDLALCQTIGGPYNATAEVLIYSPGSTRPKATINFPNMVNVIAPNASVSDLFATTFTGSIQEYRYPQGMLVGTIKGNPNDPMFGIATKPAAPLSRPF